MLAACVGWERAAADLVNREFGGCDPSFLFAWPFARVLAVLFLDAAKPVEVKLDTPEKRLAWVNRQRAKRGEPPLADLPGK